MADFYVRNSLSLTKSVKFNITLRYLVSKGDRGEHVWLLEIGTTYPDASGNPIPARKIHRISVDNLDQLIEDNVAEMCALIDWSPLVDDKKAPYVTEVIPSDSTDVSIESNVYFTIVEDLPAAGIDLSGVKVTLNNGTTEFDITGEIESAGDPYEYELKWTPPLRVYSTYEGV